uniref:centrosomal protein of 164 kDa n=1 Tax=Euleptes europaea TaxID=460621 RepID=UPI00254147BB|nr:centrosomal protein of 164 kDa [Euleptes europaea]
MASPAIRIGDQLILEEDYDEAYIPSQQEIAEFARVVGIDPEREPELMWLAREGIVAPLPAEWKPCQDITGDIYYFNFANGQSTWDHPCDEHYRQLVVQEREKLLGHGGGFKKKDYKKKKKEKKDKKEKRERDPLKRPTEVQSDLGILPSTSFYRVPSPVLLSGHMSPDLEQGSLIARNEGFLKNQKAKASGIHLDSVDRPRLFSGPTPSKLQPLLTTKSNRTHQILADVEKILGRTSSRNRLDTGYQPHEVLGAENSDATAFVFSDSEPEDLDNIRVTKPIFQTPAESFQIVVGAETVLDPGLSEDRNLFLKGENLGKAQGCSQVEGLAESWSGPRSKESGSCMVRDGGFFHAFGNEMLFSPTASSPKSVSQKHSLGTIDGQDDIRSAQNGQRLLSRMVGNRRERLLPEQGQCQIAELTKSSNSVGKSGRESACQAEPEAPGVWAQGHNPTLEIPQETTAIASLGKETGIGEDACGLRMAAADLPIQPRVGKASGAGPSGGSSMMSSLADHLDSQILGEVDNFSWDLQSSHESDHPTDQLTATQRPFLDALHAQPLDSLDKSESECSSEDQRFCQPVFPMMKRSRGAEQAVSEPLEQQQERTGEPGLEQPSGCVNLALHISQPGPEGAGGRPRPTAATFERGGLQSPGERQASIFQNRHAEADSVQDRKLKKDDSQPEGSPAGDNKEANGSLAEEKDQIKEERSSESRGQAEADKGERSQNCSSAHERVEEECSSVEKMGLGDTGTQEEEERTASGLEDAKEPDPSCQSSLKTELEKARQEEELRLRKELQNKRLELQSQSQSELEAEKERLRLEQEAALHKFRKELDSLQQLEKDRLQEQKQFALERMKIEAEAVQQVELEKLEQENMRAVGDMKERLQREKEAALEKLEMQFAAELQYRQSAATTEHLKVVSSLQSQVAEAPRRQEDELQKDLGSTEQSTRQKSHQVADYEQELSCLLEEKRQEIEQDHARRMERMRKAHQEALARLQQQCEGEERKQRAERLAALRSEQRRLEVLHEAEIEALQKKQAERLKGLRKSHQDQEEVLRKKKQEVLDEGKKLEEEINEAAVTTQLRMVESHREQQALSEAVQQLRSALLELQAQKAELESQVELLRLQSQRLQQEVSELEAASRSKQELLKKLDVQSSEASPRKMEEGGDLRVEDLRESHPAPSSREMESETNQNNEESSLILDRVRHYISTEGASIKNAKEFLVHQNHSMRKRQTTLRAVKQHWHRDLQMAQEAIEDTGRSQVLEGVRRNLEEEARQLDEMKSAMRRGQALLKKKEEKLSQLEVSLLEEFSEEDTLKGTACKKVVTFDFSDSEDSCGGANTEESPHKIVDLKPDVQFAQSDKIQYLTESLQRITSDLNGVLGFLSSFSNQLPPRFPSTPGPMSPLPKDSSIPLAAYISLAHAHSASPFVPSPGPPLTNHWAWRAGLGPRLATSPGQAVDSMLAEKWHKYFPGGFLSPCRSPGSLDGKLGCVASGEQVCLFQQRHFQAHETEKPNIQGMIEANKKWLESFKQDSRVPLLSSSPKTAAGPAGPVQLGLDDNNQIKVFHF